MSVGSKKGGVEVESAIRRAAPARNSNRGVGTNSLEGLRSWSLLADLCLESFSDIGTKVCS